MYKMYSINTSSNPPSHSSLPSPPPTHTHTVYIHFLMSQQAQISGVLFQLKDNPQVLEDVLEKVNKQYSPDLSQLIRTMLRRAFHQRPTTREMIELPLVQDCLRLSNSRLFKKSKCSGNDCDGERGVRGTIIACTRRHFVTVFLHDNYDSSSAGNDWE